MRIKYLLSHSTAFLVLCFVIRPSFAATLATSEFTEDNTGTPPGDSITITNTSTTAFQIDSITIDLSSSFGNVIFDPNNVPDIPFSVTNVIGDAGFLGTPVFSDGFLQTSPVTRTVYQALTLTFGDFDPLEKILINLDLDPDAGGTLFAVNGDDFAGSKLSITFSDGSTDIIRVGTYVSTGTFTAATTVVPIPAAVWLFGSGLLGLIGVARRKKA